MIEAEIRYDLPFHRPSARMRRPPLARATRTVKVAIPEAEPGFLAPLGTALDASIGHGLADPDYRSYLRVGGGSIWACPRVHGILGEIRTDEEGNYVVAGDRGAVRPAAPGNGDDPFGMEDGEEDVDALLARYDVTAPYRMYAQGAGREAIAGAMGRGVADVARMLREAGDARARPPARRHPDGLDDFGAFEGREDDAMDLDFGAFEPRNAAADRAPRKVTGYRNATLPEALALLSGEGEPVGPIVLTPLVACGLGPKDLAPEASEAPTDLSDDADARLRRWVDRSLRIAEGTLWIRVGAPAIAGHDFAVTHASRLTFDALPVIDAKSLRECLWSGPLTETDALAAFHNRDRLDYLDEGIVRGRAEAAAVLAETPAFAGECDTDLFVVRAACAHVFSAARKPPADKASTEAGTLRADLDAATAALAPWAALGAVSLIEPHEMPDAIAATAAVGRLLARSYPYWVRVPAIQEILAYVETLVLPRITDRPEDHADLAAFALDEAPPAIPPAPAPPAPAAFSFSPEMVEGSPVLDAGGRTLGRAGGVMLGLDGRIASIVVKAAGKTFPIPFGEVRLERPDPAAAGLAVHVDRPAFERHLLAAH